MNVHDTIINGTDLGGKHVFPHIKTLFVYFYNEKKNIKFLFVIKLLLEPLSKGSMKQERTLND